MNNSPSFLSTKPWLPLNTLLHKLHKHGQTCFVRCSRRGNLDNHYADSPDNDIVVMFWNLGVNVNNDDNDDGDDNDEDDDNDDNNDDYGKYSNNDNNDHGHYHNVTDTALIMSQYIFLLVPDGMVLTSWRRHQLSSPSGGEGKIKHRSRHDSSCIQSGPESLGWVALWPLPILEITISLIGDTCIIIQQNQ